VSAEDFDAECRALGVDPLLARALASGVPWPLAREAVASLRLDQNETQQTHSDHAAD